MHKMYKNYMLDKNVQKWVGLGRVQSFMLMDRVG